MLKELSQSLYFLSKFLTLLNEKKFALVSPWTLAEASLFVVKIMSNNTELIRKKQFLYTEKKYIYIYLFSLLTFRTTRQFERSRIRNRSRVSPTSEGRLYRNVEI